MGELTSISGNHPFMNIPNKAAPGGSFRISPLLRFLVVMFPFSLVTLARAAPPKPAPPSKAAAPPFPTKPSRYAGERVDSFVEEMTQVLAMRTRTLGPFGELQDPDAKPPAPISEQITGRKSAEPVVSLSEIIELIEITTIMPGEKRFLIGSRSVAQGEELPVTFKGKKQKIKVTQVSSDQIIFQNTSTGETAIRKLNMLPPGMTPGSRESSIPGMQPASEETPINLDPSSP